VDFLALLAHGAAAARVVGAPPERATVEPVLELLPVLRFPGLDGQAVLLLDLVAVPLRDDVEAAEGYDPQVGCEVVDVAALQAFRFNLSGRKDTTVESATSLDLRQFFEQLFVFGEDSSHPIVEFLVIDLLRDSRFLSHYSSNGPPLTSAKFVAIQRSTSAAEALPLATSSRN